MRRPCGDHVVTMRPNLRRYRRFKSGRRQRQTAAGSNFLQIGQIACGMNKPSP